MISSILLGVTMKGRTGKCFMFPVTSYRTDIPGGIDEDINKANIQEERDRYSVQNKELHNLTYGKYKAIKFAFDLDVYENNTYCFGFRDCPFSKGTFKRNGKQIPLYKLYRIAGTVISKNDARHSISLLTTSGVVNVKFTKEYYALLA